MIRLHSKPIAAIHVMWRSKRRIISKAQGLLTRHTLRLRQSSSSLMESAIHPEQVNPSIPLIVKKPGGKVDVPTARIMADKFQRSADISLSPQRTRSEERRVGKQ